MKNVLEWLEATVEKYPDKPAFSDTECSITFAQVYDIARNTGAYLIEQLGVDRTPVAVFAGRKMVTPAYFLGVVYAGRPYAPIDASLPDKRIEKILENLCPRAIVADRESLYLLTTNLVLWIILIIGSTPLTDVRYQHMLRQKKWNTTLLNGIVYAVLFILCIAYLVTETYNPFLYFRF